MTLYLKTLDDRMLLVDAPARPGQGWLPGTTFQAAIDAARAANRPLFILPCTIATGPVTIAAGTGAGRSLRLLASPGTVTIRLGGPAPFLLSCDNIPDVLIDGVTFDGAGHALTQTVGAAGAGLVRLSGRASSNARIANCVVTRSSGSGLLLDGGATATLLGCRLDQCDIGVTSVDAVLSISGCKVTDCANNGIVVIRSTQADDGSSIQSNRIGAIGNASGGTGQFGNGVLVFRAGGVRVTDNRIEGCAFSGIRINGGNMAQIVANRIDAVREHAIYLEAPGAGLDLEGGIVASNIVTGAGAGIAVANLGLYGDGASREVTVTGNQVFNITRNAMAAPYGPGQTFGAGIMATGYTTVSGNTVDNAATTGIILGTNDAAVTLTCTGNYVTRCPMGIGFSADPRAGAILIASNLVTRYRPVPARGGGDAPLSGAIVAVSYDGSTYRRSIETDYGNVDDQQIGTLRIGRNRATP